MSGRYINWGDIGARYKDPGGDATTADTVFIPQAEAEVDAALAVKYSTPFSVTTTTDAPQLVRDLCIDIAYWKMNRRADWAKQFRIDIDAMLKRLVEGDLVLTNSGGQIFGPEATGESYATPAVRSSFGVDDPECWAPSSGWKDYLASGN